MNIKEVRRIVERVELSGPFADKWFHVGDVIELLPSGTTLFDATGNVVFELGATYIQVRYHEEDIYTGELALQKARVWIVAEDASESQVVQICFGAALASSEHQTREFFKYRDKRVFGPHMHIRDLAEVAR